MWGESEEKEGERPETRENEGNQKETMETKKRRTTKKKERDNSLQPHLHQPHQEIANPLCPLTFPTRSPALQDSEANVHACGGAMCNAPDQAPLKF